MIRVHRDADGRSHPDPSASVPWTVRDARGYAVVGPPCDACGACECVPCECHGEPIHERGCVGLSYAFVRLDRWTALCDPCARAEGVEIVACTCPARPRDPWVVT
jgi:hypothetical protein